MESGETVPQAVLTSGTLQNADVPRRGGDVWKLRARFPLLSRAEPVQGEGRESKGTATSPAVQGEPRDVIRDAWPLLHM